MVKHYEGQPVNPEAITNEVYQKFITIANNGGFIKIILIKIGN